MMRQPAETSFLPCFIYLINFGSAPPEIIIRPQMAGKIIIAVVVVIVLGEKEVAVNIHNTGIKQPGILCANGNRLIVFDSVQIHIISQNMPLNGLQKGLSAAFHAFEEILTAKSHKALAG